MNIDEPKVPPVTELLYPLLQAVIDIGGSGIIEEIDARTPEVAGLSEEQLSVLHGDGPRTEATYRFAWARTYLGKIGALENSERGVWTVTEAGRGMGPDEIRRLTAEYRQRLFEARQARAATALVDAETDGDGAADDEGDGAGDWKEALLEVLLGMPPDAFERLAQRLLREAGFTSAVVTGRSGDGGIDGLGVYRMSLVSFPVFFQCKRYRGSVGAGAVRDFRGAMAGRGDKGLLITTGTFSADAQREATRDGAPPVDLIDGQRLCDLLKQHAVGVTTTVRQIEDVIVDREYFDRV
jgi:restriction system protein